MSVQRSATKSHGPCRCIAGIETLKAKGDQIQWGGPHLYADGRFATPDGKAHFSAVRPRLANDRSWFDKLTMSGEKGKRSS